MKPHIGRFVSVQGEERFKSAYREMMATLPSPVGEADIDTDFGRVHVIQFGNHPGRPLVLLPGRSGSTTMWEPNLHAWMERRTVYAIEVLGEAGMSVQKKPIKDSADQAAWLGTTIKALGIAPVHLVGVSFGGWLSFNLGLQRPDLLASLSLIDPAFVFGRPPWILLLASLATLPSAPDWLRGRMLSWISGGAPTKDEPVARVIAASMDEYQLALPPPSYPGDAELQSLSVPTLALIAAESKIHDGKKAYERARRLVPDVQAELWPGASHAISGEFADAVNARVLRFVEEVDARVLVVEADVEWELS